MDHECKHEKDFETYDKNFGMLFKFKDRVLVFIGEKESTNGALKEADNSLSGRLGRIENKLDNMTWGLLGMAVMVIIALIK